jgi:tyrosyl-tRNA synthetase
VRLDDAVVADPALLVALPAGATARVSLGRKKHAVLRGPVT